MIDKIIDWLFNTTIGNIVYVIVIPMCIAVFLSVTNGEPKSVLREEDES